MMEITLRPYQEDGVAAITSEDDHLLLDRPTGSGKGVELLTGAVRLIQSGRATHVIISTSRKDLERAFLNRGYEEIRYRSSPGSARCSIRVTTGSVTAARDLSRYSTAQQVIEDYLAGQNEGKTVMVCQSQSFVKVEIPESTEKMVLMVDEAHHSQSDKFAVKFGRWMETGGRVVLATATPYRADGKQVILDEMEHEMWTLSEHMDAGYCPKNVMVSLHQIGEGPVGRSALLGEEAPGMPAMEEMFSQAANWWAKDPPGRRHKIVFRIPPIRGGTKGTVESALRSFESVGARVFNAAGEGESVANAVGDLMVREREVSYLNSQIDVVVGVQRVAEGLDWPHCSTVMTYGIPGSKGLAVQLLGRSMRRKDESHPFPDESHFRCYVETANGKSFEALASRHSKEVLLMCCLMSDITRKREIAVMKAAMGSAPKKRKKRRKWRASIIKALESNEKGVDQARIALSQRLCDVTESTVGNAMLELTVGARVGQEEAERAVLGHLASQPGFEPRVIKAIQDNLGPDSDVMTAIKKAINEFREETLYATEESNLMAEQVHLLTGVSIREASKKMALFLPTVMSPKALLKVWDSV